MSKKSTIILTGDFGEHLYTDCSEHLIDKEGESHDSIVLNFASENIKFYGNDKDGLCFELINPDSEIFKAFMRFAKSERGY